MSLPAWVAGYVGLPWRAHGRDRQGCDCWGLVRLVLGEQFGLTLPSHAEGYPDPAARAAVGALVRGELGAWLPVAPGAEAPGTVVLLRPLGEPCHLGLWVAPGLMLHAWRRLDACLERFDGPLWGRRVAGVYRHARLGAADGR